MPAHLALGAVCVHVHGKPADLYPSVGLGAGGFPNCDLHAGLRGVASTSNIWDGQVHDILF